MVGIVVVSHSRRLADAAVELALQMVRGTPPPIEVAAGLDGHVLGTDAARVKEAIDRVASPEGVLVIMDLGSAVLSAELALELRGDDRRLPHRALRWPDRRRPRRRGHPRRRGCAVGRGRRRRSPGRTDQDRSCSASRTPPQPRTRSATAAAAHASIDLTLHNEHGLHARPAARFVETVRRFDADVTVRNLTTDGPTVSGRSVSALSTLGVPTGDQIEVSSSGRQAREALAAIAALVRRNFDEPVTGAPPRPARRQRGRGPTAASPGIGIGPKTSLAGRSTPTRPHDTAPRHPAAETERLHAAVEAARAELTLDPRSRRWHRRRARSRDLRRPRAPPRRRRTRRHRRSSSIAGERRHGRARLAVAVDALAARFDSTHRPLPPVTGRRRPRGRRPGPRPPRAATPPPTRHARWHPRDRRPDTDPSRPTRPRTVLGIVTAGGSPLSHGAILARALGHTSRRRRRSRRPRRSRRHDDPRRRNRRCRLSSTPNATVNQPLPRQGRRATPPTPTTFSPRPADRQSPPTASPSRSSPTSPRATTPSRQSVTAPTASDCSAPNSSSSTVPSRPSEDEQLEAYLSIADALGGRRLTVRTLDVGGDKPVPYLP